MRRGGEGNSCAFKVNLKGFIGNKTYNDGQDLGYLISVTDLIPQYALDYPKNTLYRIEVIYKEDFNRRALPETFVAVRFIALTLSVPNWQNGNFRI
ncbi:MAG: hypothetical protein AUJ76_02915 [Candidatus Omnitrophica bacterium CG1_02_41_171]|nr:MAG: hypothetical protein AUJ76_02915 [Candidatus Omnitrophica bacterium CG1_02_41_171]